MNFDMIVQIVAWIMLIVLFIVYVYILYPKGLLNIQMNIEKDIKTCEDCIRYRNLPDMKIGAKVKIKDSKSKGIIVDIFKYNKNKIMYAISQVYKKVNNLEYLKVVWYYEDQLEIC